MQATINNERERDEEFVYLGNILSRSGGTKEDTVQKIRKDKGVFVQVTHHVGDQTN